MATCERSPLEGFSVNATPAAFGCTIFWIATAML